MSKFRSVQDRNRTTWAYFLWPVRWRYQFVSEAANFSSIKYQKKKRSNLRISPKISETTRPKMSEKKTRSASWMYKKQVEKSENTRIFLHFTLGKNFDFSLTFTVMHIMIYLTKKTINVISHIFRIFKEKRKIR